jgi:urease accessory protein UreE
MYVVILENNQQEKDRRRAYSETECAEAATDLLRQWGHLQVGDIIRTQELEGEEL